MKKEPFYFDEKQYQLTIKKFDFGKKQIQKLVDAYNKIEGLPPLDDSNFSLIIINPVEFISKHLIKTHNVSFNGLDINPNKLFELIEKPSGMLELETVKVYVLNRLIEYHSELENKSWSDSIEISDYCVKQGSLVDIKQSALDDAKAKFSYYFKNQKQEIIHERLSSIAENFNELRKILPEDIHISDLLKTAFGHDSRNNLYQSPKELMLDPKYILNLI